MVQFKSIILIILIVLAVLFSGCTGQDVTSAVKALPEVQQFMNEHPNAQITVAYWSKEEVTQSAQEISQQCDKPITPVAMYKATVSEGDLKIVSWINAENQIVICSTTTGNGVNSKITPTSIPSPTSALTSIPTNKSKIIDLDAQQIILSDDEITGILGFDWTKKLQVEEHSDTQITLSYEKVNSNTQKNEEVKITIVVYPNITFTKEVFSGLLLESEVMATEDINIGDIGKIITFNKNNARMIMFTKNNVLATVGYIGGLEDAYKLAKKQEEKISKLLDTIN